MVQESFIKKLLDRRVPQILGSYLVAATSLVLFVEYLVDKYQFPNHYPMLALFAIIGILPTVIILAYSHGAPGKDAWTKIEKTGIPINIVFITICHLFGIFIYFQLDRIFSFIHLADPSIKSQGYLLLILLGAIFIYSVRLESFRKMFSSRTA